MIPTCALASVDVCISACVFLLTGVPSCDAEMTYYPESASGHGSKKIHACIEERLNSNQTKSL